jgi:hypothetical protein
MQGIFPKVLASNVTISYAGTGLGFAGGPVVPSVTVKISGVPYGTLLNTIMSNFMAKGGTTGNPFSANLPDISVTMTGEDLST